MMSDRIDLGSVEAMHCLHMPKRRDMANRYDAVTIKEDTRVTAVVFYCKKCEAMLEDYFAKNRLVAGSYEIVEDGKR